MERNSNLNLNLERRRERSWCRLRVKEDNGEVKKMEREKEGWEVEADKKRAEEDSEHDRTVQMTD